MLFEKEDLTREHYALAREILGLAQRDLPKNALLDELAMVLASFSGCESVGIYLEESGRYYQGSAENDDLANSPVCLDERDSPPSIQAGNFTI